MAEEEKKEDGAEIIEIFGKPFRPYRHVDLPDGSRRPVLAATDCRAVIEAWKAECAAKKRPQ